MDCKDFGLQKLPLSIVGIITEYLQAENMRKCRLVCRSWNLLLLNFLKFQVDLCDGFLGLLMKPSASQSWDIPVNHFCVHDMTPCSYHQWRCYKRLPFRISDFQKVEKLTFFEGSTLEWKKLLLKHFRWAKEIYFSPHSFPVFPSDVTFTKLEKLDISLLKRSEANELRDFFETADFPALKRLKLGFCCRKDYQTYASAHFFIVRHFATLKALRLCIEFVTGFGVKSTENFNATAFAEDGECLSGQLWNKLEESGDYKKYIENLSKLELESLSVDMSSYEGRSPWILSLILLRSQRTLKKFKLQDHEQDVADIFQQVVWNNCKTIEKISVPINTIVDCLVLKQCDSLRSFSIGENFNFLHGSHTLTSELLGSFANFHCFPSLELLTTLCIGIPLPKRDILWLSSYVRCSKFMARGKSGDFFSKEDVALILHQRRNFKKLMMLIAMNSDQRNRLVTYFWSFRELIMLYFYDHITSGLTEFKVQIAKFRLAPYKQLQDRLNREDSDYDFDLPFV